jgi:TldD protein
MKSKGEIPNDILLTQHGITEQELQRILQQASGPSIEISDIFLQYGHYEEWSLEEGIVKSGNFSIGCGAGIRSISGVKTGFAYTNDLTIPSLEEAAKKARSIASSGTQASIGTLSRVVANQLYPAYDPIASLSVEKKVEFLQKVGREAYLQDQRIKQVMVRMIGSYKVILILNSDGYIATDVCPSVRLRVTAIANNGKRYESGCSGAGARLDYSFLLNEDRALHCAREAARIALLNLKAVDAPAGIMPVVLAPGWPGIILHEAIGHGLEGDFIRKKSSVFTGRVGEKVACSECTIVDNGTLVGGASGSLSVDDEGTPTQCNVLIEKGILKGFMYDRLNARLTDNKSTGNGRRQSYAHIPCPRMTNTYMLAGNHKPEEIIASVKKGIYAVNFSGGEVDITSGKFVFSTSEAYLIENGKLSYPIKNATLISDGATVLKKVSMVGDDLQMDAGIGMCGKAGQTVPVCVGQPTLKIDELTIGGTGHG